uniref:Phytocyanin domain-containing protein n=1 Tax=Leersia perrieri TaxID=77586 RepID=A0A0D9WPB9_9ORYZ
MVAEFSYPSSHDVVKVNKTGYDACLPANANASFSDGSTTVKLDAPGKHYFICSIPSDCAAGMKLETMGFEPKTFLSPSNNLTIGL